MGRKHFDRIIKDIMQAEILAATRLLYGPEKIKAFLDKLFDAFCRGYREWKSRGVGGKCLADCSA